MPANCPLIAPVRKGPKTLGIITRGVRLAVVRRDYFAGHGSSRARYFYLASRSATAAFQSARLPKLTALSMPRFSKSIANTVMRSRSPSKMPPTNSIFIGCLINASVKLLTRPGASLTLDVPVVFVHPVYPIKENRPAGYLRGVLRKDAGEREKLFRSRHNNSTKRVSLTLALRRGKRVVQPKAGGTGSLSPAWACTAAR